MVNIKKFKKCEIVYWIKKYGWNPSIKWGIVSDQIGGMVYVDYLTPPENRKIDGVPVNEISFPTRWQKLPKKWTYDYKLFELTYDDNDTLNIDISKPEEIKKAYENKQLINAWDYDYCTFESEITKEYGWRIVKRYNLHHSPYASVEWDKLFTKYEDALKKRDSIIKEFERQANLSDEQWSIEIIKRTINRWVNIYSKTDIEKKHVLDYILSQDNIEDIETRIFRGNVEWKYWKNKRWNIVE